MTERGISNRGSGSQYLVVKTSDEKEYYVDLPKYAEKEKAQVGDVVNVGWKEAQYFFKPSDKNIARSSAANGFVYEPAKHFEWSKERTRNKCFLLSGIRPKTNEIPTEINVFRQPLPCRDTHRKREKGVNAAYTPAGLSASL